MQQNCFLVSLTLTLLCFLGVKSMAPLQAQLQQKTSGSPATETTIGTPGSSQIPDFLKLKLNRGSETDVDPFAPGLYDVVNFSIPAASKNNPAGPPKALLVFAPNVNPQRDSRTATGIPGQQSSIGLSGTSNGVPATSAPVILFLHGFNLKPEFYSQLLTHISSHGFIALAPEMYGFTANPDASGEIKAAADIIAWLVAHFSDILGSGKHLPADVTTVSGGHNTVPADVSKICVAGHSRGGKEAYGVALGKKILGFEVPYSAVIVIDPVDGTSNTSQTPPPILVHQENSLKLKAPALVIGTGLGNLGKWGIFPPCAPAWVGHEYFFSDTAGPVYRVRAAEFGHMDVLDDVTSGVLGKLTYTLCSNGEARKPMCTFTGGMSVAFLKGVFGGDLGEFKSLLGSPSRLPVKVDEVVFKEPEEEPF